MKRRGALPLFFSALTSFISIAGAVPDTVMPTKVEVVKQMRRVGDYWIVGNENSGTNLWDRATYFSGLMYQYDALKEQHYYQYANDWAVRYNWALAGGVTTRHADNQCAGQAYIGLYKIAPAANKIDMTTQCIQGMVNSTKVDDWWWIDALHMAMPVFTALGVLNNDTAYYNKMYALYSDTKVRRRLYNTTTHLWYRDSSYLPPAKTPNGKDIFWSRGNGWVFGAHTKTLNMLPATDAHYAEYLQTFKDMADALRQIQRGDGLWNSSLVDSLNYGGPETTGSVFFSFGYAWGLNKNHLDTAVYLAPLLRAWQGINSISVQPDGKLGYCQDVAGSPGQALQGTTKDYGVGTFLMAASEMLKMATGPMPDLTGNLVLNKVTNFSSELTTNRATAAVDGNIISRWSAYRYPQHIECDMGKSYQVRSIEVHGYVNRAYQYIVQGRASASEAWSTILDKRSNAVGGKMMDSVLATARYVRLTIAGCANSTDTLMGINDFRIYGEDLTQIAQQGPPTRFSSLSLTPLKNGVLIHVPREYPMKPTTTLTVTLSTLSGRTIYKRSVAVTAGQSRYSVLWKTGRGADVANSTYVVSVSLMDREAKKVAGSGHRAYIINR